jgi:hypothetical protein
MKDINRIESTLADLVALLKLASCQDWAKALEKQRIEIKSHPDQVISTILSMYGGMGSLNDIVLYKDSQPLIKENNRFNELRNRLYQLCQ